MWRHVHVVNSFLECLNSVMVCLPLYIDWNQCVSCLSKIYIYTHIATTVKDLLLVWLLPLFKKSLPVYEQLWKKNSEPNILFKLECLFEYIVWRHLTHIPCQMCRNIKYILSLGVYFYIRVGALLFVDVNTTRIH